MTSMVRENNMHTRNRKTEKQKNKIKTIRTNPPSSLSIFFYLFFSIFENKHTANQLMGLEI